MDQVISAVVDGVIVPVTGVIPVLLTSGILFLVFAALWLAFGAGMILNQGGLDNAWEWIGSLPLIVQGDRLAPLPAGRRCALGVGDELAARAAARDRRRPLRLEPDDLPPSFSAGIGRPLECDTWQRAIAAVRPRARRRWACPGACSGLRTAGEPGSVADVKTIELCWVRDATSRLSTSCGLHGA